MGFAPALAWMAAGLLLWIAQKRALAFFKRPTLPPLVTTALWFHSVLEGIVTGLSFGVSRTFGLVVLAAMTLHLVPEFFAAIALLKSAGTKNRAAALVTIGGFLIMYASFGLTYAFLPDLSGILPPLIALSGGAFIYIGAANFWRIRSFPTTVAFLIGVAISLIAR